MDQQILVILTLIGMACDGLGGLYLAYDLLGGARGPLRLLTRVVTYALCFIGGYSLLLGQPFGIVAGSGFGLALGLEYGNTLYQQSEKVHFFYWSLSLLGLFRGCILGLAAALTFGVSFGFPFGVLVSAGILIQYLLGFSPTHEYSKERALRVRRQAAIAAAIRCFSTTCAGTLAGFISIHTWQALLVGFRIGLAIGLVSVIVSIVAPRIEWWADNLPPHRLGAGGTILLLMGLLLQSLQYWIMLFRIPVR
ncbi:MAG TPA: hypothetical protein VFB12_21550 [Ktedonobacteraceae bacterium]|nr:hypothetical protein [Ktedonobacteraceae bacterium]